jgi:hypothetical protein
MTPSDDLQDQLNRLQEVIPNYDLPTLEIYQKDQHPAILENATQPIQSELKLILDHMLANADEEYYRNEMDFQAANNDFLHFIQEAEYWQKAEFIMSILGTLALALFILLLCCQKKFIYAVLMSMDELENVQKVEGAPVPQNFLDDWPVFTMDNIPDMNPENVKQVNVLAIFFYVLFFLAMICAVSFWMYKRCRHRSSLARVCFPLYPLNKWLRGSARSDIFIEITDISTGNTIWGHLGRTSVYPSRLRFIGHVNSSDLQIVQSCGCFKYIIINWRTNVLTDDHLTTIPLRQKAPVSIWTHPSLHEIVSTSHYQIKLMARVLDLYTPITNITEPGATSSSRYAPPPPRYDEPFPAVGPAQIATAPTRDEQQVAPKGYKFHAKTASLTQYGLQPNVDPSL